MMLRIAGVLVGAALLAGCGGGTDGPPMHDVTGQVTFDSEPVKEGRILFRKLDGDRKSYSAEIKDGAYALATEGGKMAVEVTASRLIPGKFDNSNGTPEPVGEMYIPAKYNAKTELVADVSPDGDNTFPFALTSK